MTSIPCSGRGRDIPRPACCLNIPSNPPHIAALLSTLQVPVGGHKRHLRGATAPARAGWRRRTTYIPVIPSSPLGQRSRRRGLSVGHIHRLPYYSTPAPPIHLVGPSALPSANLYSSYRANAHLIVRSMRVWVDVKQTRTPLGYHSA